MEVRDINRDLELEKQILELEKKQYDQILLTGDEVKKLNELYKEQYKINEQEYKLRQKTRTLNDGIFNMLKANIKTSENVLKMEKEQKILRDSVAAQIKMQRKFERDGLVEKAKMQKDIVDELRKQVTLNESSIDSMKRSVIGGSKFANVLGIASGAAQGIASGFGVIFKVIGTIYDFVSKIWDDFDKVDHAVRDISVNMGLTSSQMATFSKNTAYAAVETAKLGIGVDEVIKLQQTMGENLGRNLILTQEQIKGVAQMAKGTNLGVEGVSSMAEAFDSFGVNLDSMRNRVENVFKSTQKLGLNSSKVFKLISENLKTAQKYNFKDGTKGLEEMAKKAASIKMDLGGVFGLAEKLFDVEGAVDLSAELQVLGGSFAKLADPFQLMYQARNDVEGLTDSLIDATKNVAMFDKATGEFKIPAMELHRLRKVAEATGISLEGLVEPALQLAKQDKAMSQLANAFKYSPEQRQAIANLAQVGKDGVLEIVTSDGTKKALNALAPDEIEKILGKSSSLEQAAKSRMTFLDMLKNIGNVFTSKLFPVLEGISQRLMSGGLIEKLQTVADKIAGFLSELFTGDKVDKMIDGAKLFIDKIMGIINDVISGEGSFTQKVINMGAQLIGAMFKEAVSMFIKPLLFGLGGAALGGLLGSLAGPGGTMIGAKLGGMAGTAIGGAMMINDGTVLPNSKVISQVTPNGGLKPLAITNPQDTITASKSGGYTNMNANISFGVLKVDLGMGASKDIRMALLEDAEFMRQITAAVKQKTTQLMNGTA
jgi:hypothetical protein